MSMEPAPSQQGVSMLEPRVEQLQWWHYTNLGAYLLLVFVGVATVFGLFGRSNKEEFETILTLLTPYQPVQFIPWALVMLFEGSFAVAQALPYYRDRKVSKLVCPWYLAANVFMSVSAVLLNIGQIFLLQFSEAGGWLALLGAVWTIHATGQPTFFDYWVLRAGLGMKLGLWTPSKAINMSILAARLELSAGRQLTVALVGLTLALVIAVVSATALPKPAPWVPLFTAYTTFSIMMELENPKKLLDPTGDYFVPWDSDVIEGMRGFCALVCVTCLVLGAISMGLRFKDAPSS